MPKLPTDHKRVKNLAKRKNESSGVARKERKRATVDMTPQTLAVMKRNEDGSLGTAEKFVLKVEKAEVLYTADRKSNGQISRLTPPDEANIVAWNYFGVAATNFMHAAMVECDQIVVSITPNEMTGVVVGFPDVREETVFDTNTLLVSCKLDPEFDLANEEHVDQIENFVNEHVVPFTKQTPLVEEMEDEYVLKSYTIFKAFDGYWASAMLSSKPTVKQLEKQLLKYSKRTSYDFSEIAEVLQ